MVKQNEFSLIGKGPLPFLLSTLSEKITPDMIATAAEINHYRLNSYELKNLRFYTGDCAVYVPSDEGLLLYLVPSARNPFFTDSLESIAGLRKNNTLFLDSQRLEELIAGYESVNLSRTHYSPDKSNSKFAYISVPFETLRKTSSFADMSESPDTSALVNSLYGNSILGEKGHGEYLYHTSNNDSLKIYFLNPDNNRNLKGLLQDKRKEGLAFVVKLERLIPDGEVILASTKISQPMYLLIKAQ